MARLIRTSNEIGAIIAQRGKGWWAHYAAKIDKQRADAAVWLAEDDTKKISLFTASNYITVPELAARVSAAVGQDVHEEDDTVLRVLSAEYIDRYETKFLIAGMNVAEYNGVVVDTHQMWSTADITGRCIGLYPFEMPDGVAGLASLTQYPCHSQENREMLALDKWGGIPSQSIGALIEAYHIEDENGSLEIEDGAKTIQVFDLWGLSHYSPCPIPGQPNATTYQAAMRSLMQRAVKEGALNTDSVLLRAASGKPAKAYFEQPRKLASAAPVAAPPPAKSVSVRVDFDGDLKNLLRTLSISQPTGKTMDPKLVEFLRSVSALPSTSVEMRAVIDAALRDGGMTKAQQKHAAKLAEHVDALEGHMQKAAEACEAMGDHLDKADASRMEISKRAKALAGPGGEEEPDGDEGEKPAEKDAPKDEQKSLSLRDRVRKQAADAIAKSSVIDLAAEVRALKEQIAKGNAPAASADKKGVVAL